MSLQAGFMEECLFRAVPLSIAALIGARFGHRRAVIAVAFVLQALVFGAAHANYPGFPAYSRLVELIGPSLVWGLIFLRFGLVPTIDPARAVRSRRCCRFRCSWSRARAAR